MSGERERDVLVEHVRRVRQGHGANCSSIGSVIDTLFATATVAAAVFAAVAAALAREPIERHGAAPGGSEGDAGDGTSATDPGRKP